MKSISNTFLLIAALLGFFLSAETAAAGPLDFLRQLGHELTHPYRPDKNRKVVKKTTVKRTSSSKTSTSKPTSNDEAADADESGETVPAQTPPPAATPAQTPPPAPSPQPTAQQQKSPTALVAPSVPASQVARSDLPYGVPVPSRPGFVVSPYSPNGGYVDIRGYPSGTAVKDPYTGKIFLTP